MEIFYAPAFIRQLKSLDPELQKEVIEKIELLKKIKNHKQLKVHKLKGRLSGRYSFSINYKTRIVFSYILKKKAILLAVGDHDVYKN